MIAFQYDFCSMFFSMPGVHVADLVVQADDGLAVERGHEPQHAVRGRVVRAEVEQHRVRVVRRRDSTDGIGESTSAGG